jgi:hypothetical protein
MYAGTARAFIDSHFACDLNLRSSAAFGTDRQSQYWVRKDRGHRHLCSHATYESLGRLRISNERVWYAPHPQSATE